jgi:hypothetical protein
MEPAFFTNGFPLPETKARRARSPKAQFACLVGFALIGFSATSAAIWFGPTAVEYARDLAGSFAAKVSKWTSPRESTPWRLPDIKSTFEFTKSQVVQPPTFPQFTIPKGNGMPVPSPGGGGRPFGSTIHR